MVNTTAYFNFSNVLRATTLFTFAVVVLGAYTRLTDAGLGCPDWPGCYGQLHGVPDDAASIAQAQQDFPGWRVDVGKAQREMLHRYFAGFLGLLILAVTAIAFYTRQARRRLTLALLLLVIFQAVLGLWTVTWLLQPLVVVAHLGGGLAVLALLWWMSLDDYLPPQPRARVPPFSAAVVVGIVLLVLQILLGGWTSANYAALACPDFPQCQGRWWPEANFSDAFQYPEIGPNYQYGVLDNPTRTAIHLLHRLGALVVTVYFAVLLLFIFVKQSARKTRAVVLATALLLACQVALGIANVVLSLPLTTALLHHAFAALLLLSSLSLLRVLKSH